jgi:hypothetical protein
MNVLHFLVLVFLVHKLISNLIELRLFVQVLGLHLVDIIDVFFISSEFTDAFVRLILSKFIISNFFFIHVGLSISVDFSVIFDQLVTNRCQLLVLCEIICDSHFHYDVLCVLVENVIDLVIFIVL